MRGILIIAGGAIVGNMLAEKFLLKSGPDDTTGMFEVQEGFGMDDVARAAAITVLILLARKVLPS